MVGKYVESVQSCRCVFLPVQIFNLQFCEKQDKLLLFCLVFFMCQVENCLHFLITDSPLIFFRKLFPISYFADFSFLFLSFFFPFSFAVIPPL